MLNGLDEALRVLVQVGRAAQWGVIGRLEHVGAVGARGQRYEGYVQGREMQARVHQGRWHTLEDEAAEMGPLATGLAEDALAQIAAGQDASVLPVALMLALEDGLEHMQRYPAEVAGSRYVRTGELMVGWQVVAGES